MEKRLFLWIMMEKRLFLWIIEVLILSIAFTSGGPTNGSSQKGIKDAYPKEIQEYRSKIILAVQQKLSSLESSVEQVDDEMTAMEVKNKYLEESINEQNDMLEKLEKGVTQIENQLVENDKMLDELRHTHTAYPGEEAFSFSNETCGGIFQAQSGYAVYTSDGSYTHWRNLLRSGVSTVPSCVWTIQANHRPLITLTANVNGLDIPIYETSPRGAYVLEGKSGIAAFQSTKVTKLISGVSYSFKGPLIYVVLLFPDNTGISSLISFSFQFQYESHGRQRDKDKFFSHENIDAQLLRKWDNNENEKSDSEISVTVGSNEITSGKEFAFTSIVLSNFTTKLRLRAVWEKEKCSNTFLAAFPITDLLFNKTSNASGITNLCETEAQAETHLLTSYGKPILIIMVRHMEESFPLNLSWNIETRYSSSYINTNNVSPTNKTCGSVLGGSRGHISYRPETTYKNGLRCVWVIVPQPAPTSSVDISFRRSQTGTNYNNKEASHYDHLYIMEMTTIDGVERVDGPKITKLNSLTSPPYKANSREVYIVFYSDYSGISNGFVLNWEASGESIETGDDISTEFNFSSENNGTITIIPRNHTFFKTLYQVFIFIPILPSPVQTTPNYLFGMNFQLNYSVPSTVQDSDRSYTCNPNNFHIYAPSGGAFLQRRNIDCNSPGNDVIRNADGMVMILVKNDAAVQNRNITMNFSWNQEFPEDDRRVVKLENDKCGGVIIGERGFLRYKLEQKFNKNEHCLWLLQAPNSSSITLKVMKDGFGADDGLFVNTIDADAGTLRDDPVQLKTPLNDIYTFTEPVLVISFRPSPTTTNNGTGFLLQFWSSADDDGDASVEEQEDKRNWEYVDYRLRHSELHSGRFLYDWNNQSSHAPGKQLHVIAFSSSSVANVAARPPTTQVNWALGLFKKDNESCTYDSISFYTTILLNPNTSSVQNNFGQLWKQNVFLPETNQTTSCPNQLVAFPVEEDSGGDERKIDFTHTRITNFATPQLELDDDLFLPSNPFFRSRYEAPSANLRQVYTHILQREIARRQRPRGWNVG